LRHGDVNADKERGAMKKIVDIELLLQWVINEELPKGQHLMKPAWKVVEEYAGARARGVRETHAPTAGGVVSGEPHPDAIVVARILKGEFDRAVSLRSAFSNDEEAKQAARALVNDLVKIDPQCIDVALTAEQRLYALLLSSATLRRPPTCACGWDNPRAQVAARQRVDYILWWYSLAAFVDTLNRRPAEQRMTHHIAVGPRRSNIPWKHTVDSGKPLHELTEQELQSLTDRLDAERAFRALDVTPCDRTRARAVNQ
jgi:hypothetical protein